MVSQASSAAWTPSQPSGSPTGKSNGSSKEFDCLDVDDEQVLGHSVEGSRLPLKAFKELLEFHERRIVTDVIVAIDARLSGQCRASSKASSKASNRARLGSVGSVSTDLSVDKRASASSDVRSMGHHKTLVRQTSEEPPALAVVPAPKFSAPEGCARTSQTLPPPVPSSARKASEIREVTSIEATNVWAQPKKLAKTFAEQEKELMEANQKLAESTKTNVDYGPPRDNSMLTRGVASIVRSNRFDSLVTGLILGNALLIGAQSEWGMTHYFEVGDTTPVWIRVLDTAFVVSFTIELLLRVLFEGRTFFRMYNKNVYWNALDAALVMFGLTDELVKIAWSSAPDTGVFRILRVLRLVRVVRVIRVARFFADLRVMVAGILCSLKSLMWAILLLLIISFMFGVCVMEFVSGKLTDLHLAGLSDCDTSPAPYGLAECPSQLAADCQLKHLLLQYWGSVIRSVYTLFQAMCGGVDWGLVAEPLVEITPVMGLLFCMYIAVAVFCVMNIVTGVFVENAKMMTAQDETNQIMENMEKRRIWFNAVKELWRTLDEEGVGELDLHRFAESLSDVRTQVFFEKMGIEVTTESVEGLFTLLDFNGNGKVDIDELALGIQMLHGSAKGIDVARVSYSTMMVRKQLDELVDFCFIEIPKIIGIQAFEAEDSDELGEEGDEVVELGSLNTPASPKSDKGGEPGSPSGRAKEGLADIALRRRSTRRCISPGKETFPGGANQQCPLDAHVENFRRPSMGYGAKNSVAPLKSGSMSGGSLSSLAASLGLGRMTASPSTTSLVHMESHDDGLHRPDCPIGRQDDGVHRLDRPMSRQHSPKRSHSPQSPYPP